MEITSYLLGKKSSGGGDEPDVDWTEIGYEEQPGSIQDGYDYAKEIYDNWDASITNRNNAFKNDYKLEYFPNVDMSNVVSCGGMFYNCGIRYFDTIEPGTSCNDMGNMFYNDTFRNSLKGKKLVVRPSNNSKIIYFYRNVEIDDLYLYYGYNDTQYVFYSIQSLKIKKITGNETSRTKEILYNCTMDDNTIKEFLKYFKTLTSQPDRYKSLKEMGFTEANCNQAVLLDEWQDLVNAGWITGY